MMRILLAVDGSACADRAAREVVALASALREPPEIHLLYVHPPLPVGSAQAHVGHDDLQRYYREDSAPHLEGAERLLEAGALTFTRHLHVGDAAAVIAHVAAELACTRIVLGCVGRSAVADAVLGSVAHSVVRRAPCPVLLVK